eukprot:gene11019-12269_t
MMMNEVSFAESIDRLKESFLWAAAQGGNTQDCQQLIEIGADVNWKHTNGDTPLLAACRRGHSETVGLLLAYGADSNLVGTDSLSPLHIAATRGDVETLDKLLESNAVTTTKTKEGLTALDIAKAKGHENIYARLMRSRRPLPANNQSRALNSRGIIADPIPGISGRENLPSISNIQSGLTNHASRNNLVESAADTIQQVPPRPVGENVNVNASSSRKKADRRSQLEEDLSRMMSSTSISGKNTTQSESSGRGYSIMGDSSSIGTSSEETVALRKLLETEISKRKAFEAKLEIFASQNKQLLEELTSLNIRMQTSEECSLSIKRDLDRMKAVESIVQEFDIYQCEALEVELKDALVKVEKRKAFLIRNQIDSQKEQRLEPIVHKISVFS